MRETHSGHERVLALTWFGLEKVYRYRYSAHNSAIIGSQLVLIIGGHLIY